MFFDLRATNIHVTLYNLRFPTHRTLSSEGVSELSFSLESSNENTAFRLSLTLVRFAPYNCSPVISYLGKFLLRKFAVQGVLFKIGKQ